MEKNSHHFILNMHLEEYQQIHRNQSEDQ